MTVVTRADWGISIIDAGWGVQSGVGLVQMRVKEEVLERCALRVRPCGFGKAAFGVGEGEAFLRFKPRPGWRRSWRLHAGPAPLR
jgi:hypothetical protein